MVSDIMFNVVIVVSHTASIFGSTRNESSFALGDCDVERSQRGSSMKIEFNFPDEVVESLRDLIPQLRGKTAPITEWHVKQYFGGQLYRLIEYMTTEKTANQFREMNHQPDQETQH